MSSSSTQMISGLSSGIDWRSMVDQLIALDARQVTQIQTQQSTLEDKRSAWQDINGRLAALKSAVETLRDPDLFSQFTSSMASSSSTDAEDILSLTLSTNASRGSFDIEVQQRATSEKLSSTTFTTNDEALGLSGEFLLGGRLITVTTTDTLISLRNKINTANSGTNASGVSASILTSGTDSYRLVLTAAESGETGVDIKDASSTNIVQTLGFATATTQIKNETSSGAQSDTFESADTSVANLLGLSGSLSGTVNIGAYSGITIDLSDSITAIKDSINTQAGATIASVVSSEDDDGNTVYSLKLIGTSYTDDNNVLQALGVLESTHSDVAEVHKSSALAQTSGAGGGAITAATTFAQINTGSDASSVLNGDTITISGKDHDGNAISGSFAITDTATTTIGDLLAQIETLFGGSGNSVTASVDADGKITVTDDTTGDSQMTVSLIANNEGGGTLDFGSVAVSTEGRAMQVQAGQNARFVVDGMTLESESNTIEDVVAGVTMDLLKAEVGTTVSVSIARDKAGIRSDVNSFVSAYNSSVQWIADQMAYDEDAQETGGPLFGDSTLTGLNNQLMSTIISQVSGTATDTSTLALLGIKLQEDGTLEMNTSTFDSMIDSDFDNVVSFFSAQGTASTSTLSYINYTRDTQQGTYDVVISQAAEQASVTGSANLDDADGLDGDETLTITDKSTGQIALVSLTSGMDLADVISAINSELSRAYTQTLTEDTGHSLTSAAGGGVITNGTTWDQINTGGDANDISDDEVITFSITLRGGSTVSGSYTIEDKTTDTVSGLLDAIETASGDSVTARLDDSGRIVVTDARTGTSSLGLSISYGGAGSLSFDTMSTTTTGRYAMEITAGDGGSGQLALTHDTYGSSKGFTLAQSANFLGLADAETVGVDVAGTINGEAATGNGQTLTGDSGESNIDGLVIKYTGTSTGNIGTIGFNLGFAESMERVLFGYTDPYTGFVETKRDGLQTSIDSMNDQIDRLTVRLEMKREQLINQFVAMERTMNTLQNQSSWMSAQLSSV